MIDPRLQISAEDRERIEFLERLDAAPLAVSEWEDGIIKSFLTNARPMTPGQRAAVDVMREQYEHCL